MQPLERLNIMKTTKTVAATPPVTANTTSANEMPEVWLSADDMSALRNSISLKTLQDLLFYHEDLWDVLCRGRNEEYLGYVETNRVPQLDTFVRMLIADSQKLRGAKFKATLDAQVAALKANWAMRDDPLWKLDDSEILAIKS